MTALSQTGRRQVVTRLSGIVFLGALLSAGASSTRSEADTGPKTHVVTIENLRFSPDALTVEPGDRVVWINKDLFPHTATADTKAFDSQSIGPNASWTYVARKSGEYAYGCTFHPTMKATLKIR